MKEASSKGVTITVCVVKEEAHPASVTVNVMFLVPGVSQLTV